MKKAKNRQFDSNALLYGAFAGGLIVAVALAVLVLPPLFTKSLTFSRYATSTRSVAVVPVPVPTLDTRAYDRKMLAIAHVATSSPFYTAFLNGTTTKGTSTPPQWPVRAPYPNYGALLPANRIIAYYGNFYSTGMGALGKWPVNEMLQRLQKEVALWQVADPSTPVIPAMHYIVETAQASPGKEGKYLARMPDDQIDKAIKLADQVHGIVFIDFQVALSTLEKELPLYKEYLKKPQVHLGIDPEFSMKTGDKPGSVIGTYDAADVNFAAQYLATLVKENNLPPKILVVHRFTQDMLTHASRIRPLPEVQIVIDMDGWGSPAKKIGTYTHIVAAEPVQFTGFKLFYVNDFLPPSTGMLKPSDLLKLTPQPMYIQYQ